MIICLYMYTYELEWASNILSLQVFRCTLGAFPGPLVYAPAAPWVYAGASVEPPRCTPTPPRCTPTPPKVYAHPSQGVRPPPPMVYAAPLSKGPIVHLPKTLGVRRGCLYNPAKRGPNTMEGAPSKPFV